LPLHDKGTPAVSRAAQSLDEPRPTQAALSNHDFGATSKQTIDEEDKFVAVAREKYPPLRGADFERGLSKTQANGPVAFQTIEQPKTTASPEVRSGRQQGRTGSEGLEAMVKPALPVAREQDLVIASEAVRSAGQPPATMSLNLSRVDIELHPEAINHRDYDLRSGRQEHPPLASKQGSISAGQAVSPYVQPSIKPLAASTVGISSEAAEAAQRGLQRTEDAASIAAVTGAERANAIAPNSGPDSGIRSVPAHASSVVRQMAEALPRLADSALEITLRPEELGRIRLTLVAAETGTFLHVTAERPDTLELVRRNLGLLTQEFAAQGFGHLDVALGGRQDTPAGHVSADAEAQPAIPDSDTPTTTTPDNGLTRLGDTLDIRI
jgi:hypothetical protein